VTLDEVRTLRWIALGDSYTIGTSVRAAERWPDQLVARLAARPVPGVAVSLVANLAVNGWTSADVVARQLPVVERERPDLVSLLVGVNDVVQGVPPATYRANVRTLLDALVTSARRDGVVTVETPDYTLTPAGEDYGDPTDGRAAIDTVNAILAEESAARGIAHVDGIAELSRRVTADPSLVATDGLHPSGSQYATWVDRIERVVRDLVRRITTT
jgi:acyl-CoA thioesterase I